MPAKRELERDDLLQRTTTLYARLIPNEMNTGTWQLAYRFSCRCKRPQLPEEGGTIIKWPLARPVTDLSLGRNVASATAPFSDM